MILADNLIKLRKLNKLTQVELASKLGFSDKAVSKWENGDTTPDIETIYKLASIYNVSIDSLLKDEPIITENDTKQRKKILTNKIIITLLSVVVVWSAAIVFFATLVITHDIYYWQSFILAIPASFVILLIFNSIWGKPKFNFIIVSCLLWTICLAIHMQYPASSLWLIYIVGIPAQIAVILASQLKITSSKSKE